MLTNNRLLAILVLICLFVLGPLALIYWADSYNKSLLVNTDNKPCALPKSEIDTLETSSSQSVVKDSKQFYFITFRNTKNSNLLTAITVNQQYLGFISLDLGGVKTPTTTIIRATLNKCLVSTPENFQFWYRLGDYKLGQIQPTDNLTSSTFPVDTVIINPNIQPTLEVDVEGKDGGYKLFEYPPEKVRL
jgi:hypothetical protein